MTFVGQYVAFKTRKPDYISLNTPKSVNELVTMCQQEHLEYLLNLIGRFQVVLHEENGDRMWDIAGKLRQMLQPISETALSR